MIRDGDLKVQILPTLEKNKWSLYVNVPQISLELDFKFLMTESFTWVQPLQDDHLKYYLTHRNAAVLLSGQYTVEGVKTECSKDCLMAEDSFRAHMSYPVNYFQTIIQTVLDDGRTFGVFLGDGVGSHMADKTSGEDFLTLDGKIYKLDLTLLEDNPSVLMSGKAMKTIGDSKVFPERSCELTYTPEHQLELSVYLLFIVSN